MTPLKAELGESSSKESPILRQSGTPPYPTCRSPRSTSRILYPPGAIDYKFRLSALRREHVLTSHVLSFSGHPLSVPVTMSGTKEVISSPAPGSTALSPSASLAPASAEKQSIDRENAPSGPPSKPLSKIWHRTWTIITWTPPQCRWDPENPPQFSMALNILFGFAAMFTVANLYYSHALLDILAHDFNVDYEEVSRIPTLMQAGYAAGLLFLCPLGDLVRRRPFVLILVFFTATIW
jgi:hypothetical protein